MFRHQTGGGCRRRRASGVARTPVRRVDLVQHPFEIGLDEMPRAHVARLFLTPDHFGAPEASELLHQRLQRHRIELFDPHEVDVVDAALFALLVEVVIDLARAQHNAAYLVVRHQLDLFVWQHHRVIVENAVESGALAQFVKPRDRALVPQQRLRRHHDQGLADFAMQLTPQRVEEIGGRGGIDHLHIVFGAHLQEAFETRRGMLRPLPFIPMRQHADEAGHAQPFALAGGDELVEQHLRAVGKVAELRFPDRERIRLRQRVAIFEAEHGFFREQRVDDFIVALIAAEMIERRVAALVFLVDQHRMPLREGAALAVLSRQADVVALLQQRAERQRLAGRPIDPDAVLDRLGAIFQKALRGAVNPKAVRHLGDLAADIPEHRDIDAGNAAAGILLLIRRLEACPLAVEPVRLVGLVPRAGFKLGVEPRTPVGLGLLDLAFGHHAFGDQPLGIDFERRGMRRDLLVHHRLGERRLVAFVVAVSAVAEHVDDDGFMEFLPELDRDLGPEHHGFRVVAIHVEDRRVDHLRHIGGIGRGARVTRIGGEADLVVDDEMQRTSGAVAFQVRQPEALGHHALPGERGIAMHQQRQHRDAHIRRVAMLVLLGAHFSEHHGIHDLQMRRVRRERQMDSVVVEFAVR